MSLRRVVLESREKIPAGLAFLRGRAGPDSAVAADVAALLRDVRERGDAAVVDQVRKFEWPCPGPAALKVGPEFFRASEKKIGAALLKTLRSAAASIRRFHERQRAATTAALVAPGVRAEIKTHPLESVGLYVPGGRASYPSTLLMLAIPAQLAGVRRIAVASPAGPDGRPATVLGAAASILGLKEMYGVGGAAAIGAFAEGTATIARVDKIMGPGNAWVTEAKRQVYGSVGIDGLSGPTELAVLSDGHAPARWIAADLLAQAEHDPEASVLLLTTDPTEPDRVEAELERLLRESPRAEIQKRSLADRSAIFLCPDLELACEAVRALAPEHLSIMTRTPARWAERVSTAAAVFLGPRTAQAAGDFGAGPNHCLPTGGTARFASPVGVWDFVRYQSRVSLDGPALKKMARWMIPLAEAEGLPSHAVSLSVREES